MAVRNADLVDLIATTLDDLPKQEFEVTWDNVDYEFSRIYQDERMSIDGGNAIVRKIMFDESGNARYRRLYDTDEPAVNDVIDTITVPWTQIGTNYSWDKFEILRNRNNAKGFVDLMETRKIDGMWSLFNLIEDAGWKTPTNATDDLFPFGVPYYINQLTKTQTDAGTVNGFNGQTIVFRDATTSTTCAGIDASTQAKWRNYAATYTQVNNAMLKIFRRAFMASRFKAPIGVIDPSDKRVAPKRIYTGLDTAVQLSDLADRRDDNHAGTEVVKGLSQDDAGNTFINRLPVVNVTELDSVSDSPIYCIDFSKFVPVVHEGYWGEETEPMTDRGAHTTFTVFIDGAHNNLCLNRRKAGFVLHTAHTS